MAKKKDKTKKEMVESILKGMEKKYGEKLGLSTADELTKTFLKTGLYEWDAFNGGLLRGAMHLLYGPYSSGKTTLAAMILAKAQEEGFTCLWIDAEGSLDKEYIASLGVDTKALWVLRAETMEMNLDPIVELISEKAIDLVVYDSIAAVSSAGEKFDSKGKKLKELDKDTISQIPRVTSKLNRRISTDVARNDVTILYLSQVRANISLGGPGAPDQPQGGNSVLHHSATIMRLHRSYAKDKVLKNETEYLQWPVVLTFEKNKVNGIEGKQIEFIWERQKGPNIEISTLYSALKAEIIIQSSSWFSYKDIKVQGFDKFCELALEEREIYDAICRELAGEVEKEKEEIKEEVKNETEEE